MLLQQGDFLDQFRILEVIGSGGFSVVYKAEDTQLERLVAINSLTRKPLLNMAPKRGLFAKPN